jgi:hypothetical protein
MPQARGTPRDGLYTFEVLVEEYAIDDPAVALLAWIVQGADISKDRDATPRSRGLLVVAEGFHLLGLEDHRQLELRLPVYDALRVWCRSEVAPASAPDARLVDPDRPRADRPSYGVDDHQEANMSASFSSCWRRSSRASRRL